LILSLVNVKSSGQQTYIILSGGDEIVAVRSVQLIRPRVFGIARVRDFFLMAHRKCDDSVFAYKLSVTAMILPFGVQFHTDQRLLVWRPRGLLDEKVVTDVVAALGQLEMELHEPFNRFLDTAGVEQIELNYEYVISVAFYRRFAYADRKPIKSAILATHPEFIHYAQLHALLTRGSSIDVRIFPDDRPAVAQWLDAPVELIALDST
jgi:hypothetical protein